jgi:hypothetical protein
MKINNAPVETFFGQMQLRQKFPVEQPRDPTTDTSTQLFQTQWMPQHTDHHVIIEFKTTEIPSSFLLLVGLLVWLFFVGFSFCIGPLSVSLS